MSAPPSDNIYVADLPAGIDEAMVQTIFSAYGTVQSCKVLPSKGGGKGAAMVRVGSVSEAQWIVDNLNGNIAQGLSTPVQVRFANSSSKGKDGGKGYDGGWGKDGGGYGKAGGKGGWSSPSPYEMPGKGYDGGKGKGKGGKGKGTECDIRTLKQGVKGAGVLPGVGMALPNECQLYIKNLPSDTQDVDLYELFSPFGAIAPRGVKAMQQDGCCSGIGFVDFLDMEHAQAAIMTLNGTTMPDGSMLTVSNKQAGKGKGGK